MSIDRRNLLRSAMAGLVAVALLLPAAASALTKDEAADFVSATIKDVAALMQSDATSAAKAAELRQIMERRGAMPEIARFVAGTVWRGMSEAQRESFVTAFTGYISGIYARRFQEYAGEAKEVAQGEMFTLGDVTDAGKKGMLVRTRIQRANEAPVVVDWLVSDSPGKTVIADIVIEGVSLLVTQREEIGSMLEARGGNVDKLIEHLASA